jgi:hypothetical protein
MLSGFTLTNGLANNRDGGGVFCASTNAVVTNCLIINNQAAAGGGAYNGTYFNCTFTGNAATNLNTLGYGGGVSGTPVNGGDSVLNNCYLDNNIAFAGGGASLSVMNNCIVSNNVARPLPLGQGENSGEGGGVFACTVQNSLIISNAALTLNTSPQQLLYFNGLGGGAYYGSLVNCVIQGNNATSGGGAASDEFEASNCTLIGNVAYELGGGFDGRGTVINCLISGNRAGSGGGSCYGNLINCVITGNVATNDGGGVCGEGFSPIGVMYNCTVCLNSALNEERWYI